MSGPTHAPDNRERCSTESTVGNADPSSSVREETVPVLQLTVVEYDTSPDRGTIYPQGLTGIERMETWISADMTAFIELSAWR